MKQVLTLAVKFDLSSEQEALIEQMAMNFYRFAIMLIKQLILVN
ncbi:MAG: hypothetical protein QNJ68_04000 [Microcoleaceae cyanobacterium MO_207.B10]|nr:hypothetical protein [Microcoleaceae cyanobacterium MO_207.B10]